MNAESKLKIVLNIHTSSQTVLACMTLKDSRVYTREHLILFTSQKLEQAIPLAQVLSTTEAETEAITEAKT